MPPRHVVFATFGSLGDVHPFLAIGRVLQERGHRVTLATSEFHRAKIEAEGFAFHAVRPDIAEFGGPAGLMRMFCAHPLAPLFVVRRLILTRLRETCADLLAAARDADFLAAHPIFYPAPMIAEKLGLPWAGAFLQPMAFFSAHDPPMARWLPPPAHRIAMRFGRLVLHPVITPIAELRAELGLPRARAHPMFGGQFSPQLNLALFSPPFAPPQPDWPRGMVASGFPFFDRTRSDAERMPAALEAFLNAGAPPVVFTPGSTVVDISERFQRESLFAARALGVRAVLLTGRAGPSNVLRDLPPQIHAAAYAPHAALFPRAAAIVHVGGIGTTAQALRAARPQLVVPYGFDQPDNARRVRKLGLGQVLPHGRYDANRAANALRVLLDDTAYTQRAADFAESIAHESGADTAANLIEAALRPDDRLAAASINR